jgi:hypothetical protein
MQAISQVGDLVYAIRHLLSAHGGKAADLLVRYAR